MIVLGKLFYELETLTLFDDPWNDSGHFNFPGECQTAFWDSKKFWRRLNHKSLGLCKVSKNSLKVTFDCSEESEKVFWKLIVPGENQLFLKNLIFGDFLIVFKTSPIFASRHFPVDCFSILFHQETRQSLPTDAQTSFLLSCFSSSSN